VDRDRNISLLSQASAAAGGRVFRTPFTAEIVYESATPGVNVNPPCCEFSFASPVISLAFDIGDYSFATPPGPATGGARYSGNFFSIGLGVVSPTLESPSAGLNFVDTAGPSLSLPVAPPGLFATFFVNAGDGIYIEGSSSNISYSVPEPIAPALLLCAVLARISLRRAAAPRSSRR
jgi:hypothetical protein